MSKKTKQAMAAAMMSAESDIPVPTRARISSFASLVADLEVYDHPAVKAMRLDEDASVLDTVANLPAMREKLRNSATSSVSSAKRRNPGAEYKVEISDFMTQSGIYAIALIHRVA